VTEILDQWEAELDTSIAELEQQVIQTRRYLHAHPEPSGEEVGYFGPTWQNA